MLLLLFFITRCGKKEEPVLAGKSYLFSILDSAQTGIAFSNNLHYNETLNPYTFRNFFNGGGVGIADFNNDGLADIFLCGNQVPNRLYLNKGNLKFQDITEAAGLYFEGTWTTGVSLADVNGDGWMDIYLCKSGPPGGDRRHNELYINNGNLTFTERSKEYGLNFEGLSVHAAFFDYDRDGDLDCYLLNNSIRSVGKYDLRKDQRKIPDPAGGNKLLRNDGSRFTDVTLQAGIYSSQIGFGLGVAVSDINLDGWPDLYVANDFFEKDYLYLNQRNGTFREQLEDMMTEISLGSMGADIADINNDGLPEIFVTEMLPETDYRLKTTSQFENWTKYSENVKNGYFRQFSRNVLQLNNGNGTFSEIGRYAGVQATDWSWGALMFDMDNDGWKDIFVANGIYKDLLNQDYANFVANPVFIRSQIKKGAAVITQLIDTIPSNKISNYFFRNNGNLTFSNMSGFWVADAPGFSNGSAYADLDNDGDLDLVINNVNMPVMVLENNATRYEPASNYFALQLIQSDKNRFAVGSKVWIWAGGRSFYQELFPARGFMSSVDYRLFFGLGDASAIDSMVIQWPDGKHTLHKNLRANAFLTVAKENSQQTNPVQKTENPAWFVRLNPSGIQFSHTENEYDDFNFDRLLFIMTSNEGPCLCKGDVNADGLDDFYIGGATGQPGKLYVQTTDGKFKSLAESIFEADRQSEDVSCVFFDANGDGRDDLYVASGGREFSSSSFALVDRLYFSNTGSVTKSTQVLPHGSRFSLSSTVTVADFNHDGFPDLFVGARHRPQAYGVVSESYLLLNDGKGHLTDVTADWLPALKQAGMVTAAAWADVNADGRPDLVLAGEWMPIRLFINRDSGFVDETPAWGLGQSNGWYHALEITDVNNDGRPDLVVGNHGLNSMFRASASAPLMMWVNDFDNNGTTEQIIARNLDGKYYPYVLLPEFLAQMPVFKKKFLYYNSYAGQPVENIFGSEMLTASIRYEAFDFASSVWLNRGNRFERVELPQPAQFMPVYAIHSRDVNHDGNTDLILGGNQSRAKPQTGAYMAGYGVVLSGNGNGTFRPLSQAESGISVRGDVRNIATIEIRREPVTLFALSDGPLYFFKSKFKNK